MVATVAAVACGSASAILCNMSVRFVSGLQGGLLTASISQDMPPFQVLCSWSRATHRCSTANIDKVRDSNVMIGERCRAELPFQ